MEFYYFNNHFTTIMQGTCSYNSARLRTLCTNCHNLVTTLQGYSKVATTQLFPCGVWRHIQVKIYKIFRSVSLVPNSPQCLLQLCMYICSPPVHITYFQNYQCVPVFIAYLAICFIYSYIIYLKLKGVCYSECCIAVITQNAVVEKWQI